MPEIDEVLAEVRAKQPAPRRRAARVALIAAGIGVAASVVAGVTLAVAATTSIAGVGLTAADSSARAQPPVVELDAADAAPTAGPAPSAAPVADPGSPTPVTDQGAPTATTEAGSPLYDASTDIASIPRPPIDWSADELANAEVWLEQNGIIADCMLEQGYDYLFTPWWLRSPEEPAMPTSPVAFGSDEWVALYGPVDQGLGDDYDWQNAGCTGYAVHITGMDDAH